MARPDTKGGEQRSKALSRLREEERRRQREFRSFDEFGRTIPEIMQDEDTPRQRMRIGLPADWVSPRAEEIQPKVDDFNPDYRPGGGDKKIFHEKLEIQTGSKINSLQNQDYQPGGGDKPIFSEKLAFQKEARPKVGSLENADYRPRGGDKKFVHSERLQWTDKPALNTRENIDYHSRPSNVRIISNQVDFSERAQPKVGSLENTSYEPRPSGVRVYHEKLPWLEHGSNRPRLRRSSGEHYPGGSYESRREFAEEMEDRAKRQDGGGTRRQPQKPQRASSEEAAQRAALRERQREFAQRTAAEAAAKPAPTRQRRLPNERDPKQPDPAAEAAAAERKRRQQQLQEEKERREQRERLQQIELQKQKEQQRQQQEQKLQQQKQLEKQRQKERQQQQQQQQQKKQPGNDSEAAQKASGAKAGGAPKKGAATADTAGQDGMAKNKQKVAASGQKEAKQQQKKTTPQQQQQQQQQREPDEWEYARHEFDRPKQPQKKKNQKSGKKASQEEEASSAVPPLSLPDEAQPDEAGATSRGAKDLYKTEGYAKRFELAPTSVTNRSLILAPLENYRHDWHEDAEVKVRMDAEGRLVLKSNRKVPTRLPRVAEADPPAPATYVSSITKKERQLYDPKPKLVTGEDLGHLLPRLENLLETSGAPKKHYSQYSVAKRPVRQPVYGETMQRQRERGYRVNPEGERVALISSDDYNNQFYSEVRVRDAQLEPRTTGQYARNFEQQQQQQLPSEPQPDELSDRLMLQPSDQLPHYRPDGDSQPPPVGAASSLLLDYGEDEEGDAATGTNSSQAGGRAQRRPRRFVNWKPGEVLYATGERPAAGGPSGDAAAAAAYSEKLKRQRQQQQQQQHQGKAGGAGFSGLHEQRKNWYRDYNQRMLAREGNVEKVSERDLLQTTYELY